MKLISVQSRGNRLVRIEKDTEMRGVGGYSVILKSFNRRNKSFTFKGFWYRNYKSEALKAAAEWLEGAKE
jgi:hypothetical protein